MLVLDIKHLASHSVFYLLRTSNTNLSLEPILCFCLIENNITFFRLCDHKVVFFRALKYHPICLTSHTDIKSCRVGCTFPLLTSPSCKKERGLGISIWSKRVQYVVTFFDHASKTRVQLYTQSLIPLIRQDQ